MFVSSAARFAEGHSPFAGYGFTPSRFRLFLA